MSAFIVSENHIRALVEPNLQWKSPHTFMSPDAIGHMLWMENHASFWHLYREVVNLPQFTYQPSTAGSFGIPLPLVRLKLLQSYEYQSCEHPEWKESEAFAYCQALRLNLINHLPGYTDAPWSIA